MNAKDEARLHDMRRAAKRARTFADGHDRDDLDADDELLGFAIVRAVELVGEAASQVTLETRQAHPQIP